MRETWAEPSAVELGVYFDDTLLEQHILGAEPVRVATPNEGLERTWVEIRQRAALELREGDGERAEPWQACDVGERAHGALRLRLAHAGRSVALRPQAPRSLAARLSLVLLSPVVGIFALVPFVGLFAALLSLTLARRTEGVPSLSTADRVRIAHVLEAATAEPESPSPRHTASANDERSHEQSQRVEKRTATPKRSAAATRSAKATDSATATATATESATATATATDSATATGSFSATDSDSGAATHAVAAMRAVSAPVFAGLAERPLMDDEVARAFAELSDGDSSRAAESTERAAASGAAARSGAAGGAAGAAAAGGASGSAAAGAAVEADGMAYGADGLGLTATGEGGGGEGEGTIGLGNIGTLGRGGGTGEGFGYGTGRGGMAGREVAVIRCFAPSPRVRGALDRAIIQRVVRAHTNELRGCYERALERDASLFGRVLVRFRIEPNGLVSSASAEGEGLAIGSPRAREVARCVSSAVTRFSFPAVPNGVTSTIVSYPFLFSVAGDAD